MKCTFVLLLLLLLLLLLVLIMQLCVDDGVAVVEFKITSSISKKKKSYANALLLIALSLFVVHYKFL